MACASCAKKKANSYQDMKAVESPPFRATDIHVYDTTTGESRRFDKSDYNTNITNVLLFVPNVEAIKEYGELKQEEGVNYTYLTAQPLHQIQDFYANGGKKPENATIFSSYLLASRLNLILNGQTKKAIVYVMSDGDLAKQELFYHSSFNYSSIGLFLEDYHDSH